MIFDQICESLFLDHLTRFALIVSVARVILEDKTCLFTTELIYIDKADTYTPSNNISP